MVTQEFIPRQSPLDPLRRPQWRADRVFAMVEHRPRPLLPRQSRDDHPIRLYRRYLLNIAAAATHEERRLKTINAFPSMHCAHQLYHSPDQRLRNLLEAWLLTDESFENIDKRLSLAPRTCEYYEPIFFDVRSRLQNRDFMNTVILGSQNSPGSQAGGAEREQARYYKSLAYHGGRHVLEAFLSGFPVGGAPRSPRDVAGWMFKAMQQQVLNQSVAAMQAPSLSPSMLQLLKMSTAANAGRDEDTDLAKLERMTQGILATINYESVSDHDRQQNPAYQILLNSPVEPRASEMIKLSRGEIPESLLRDIERVKSSVNLAPTDQSAP